MYRARDQDEILEELKSFCKTSASKVEGSFAYDSLAANSIEFAKVEVELEEAYRQTFGHTATGEYLTMIAEEYGVIRKRATRAIGKVTVTGKGELPRGSLFSTEEGIRFQALETVQIQGSLEVSVEALETGERGNVGIGAICKMPFSIPGFSGVKNAKPTHDGFTEESDERLRARYLLKVRTPATSGNRYHYLQ